MPLGEVSIPIMHTTQTAEFLTTFLILQVSYRSVCPQVSYRRPNQSLQQYNTHLEMFLDE
jgi:hypothetical protein